jgi:hypothetical protein
MPADGRAAAAAGEGDGCPDNRARAQLHSGLPPGLDLRTLLPSPSVRPCLHPFRSRLLSRAPFSPPHSRRSLAPLGRPSPRLTSSPAAQSDEEEDGSEEDEDEDDEDGSEEEEDEGEDLGGWGAPPRRKPEVTIEEITDDDKGQHVRGGVGVACEAARPAGSAGGRSMAAAVHQRVCRPAAAFSSVPTLTPRRLPRARRTAWRWPGRVRSSSRSRERSSSRSRSQTMRGRTRRTTVGCFLLSAARRGCGAMRGTLQPAAAREFECRERCPGMSPRHGCTGARPHTRQLSHPPALTPASSHNRQLSHPPTLTSAGSPQTPIRRRRE